jgi:hypothetical protein
MVAQGAGWEVVLQIWIGVWFASTGERSTLRFKRSDTAGGTCLPLDQRHIG